jgi:hypothetical protein
MSPSVPVDARIVSTFAVSIKSDEFWIKVVEMLCLMENSLKLVEHDAGCDARVFTVLKLTFWTGSISILVNQA